MASAFAERRLREISQEAHKTTQMDAASVATMKNIRSLLLEYCIMDVVASDCLGPSENETNINPGMEDGNEEVVLEPMASPAVVVVAFAAVLPINLKTLNGESCAT